MLPSARHVLKCWNGVPPRVALRSEPNQELKQPAWDLWTVRAVSRGWRDVFDGMAGVLQVSWGAMAMLAGLHCCRPHRRTCFARRRRHSHMPCSTACRRKAQPCGCGWRALAAAAVPTCCATLTAYKWACGAQCGLGGTVKWTSQPLYSCTLLWCLWPPGCSGLTCASGTLW